MEPQAGPLPATTDRPLPCRLRGVAIDTWRENVAYLHRDCAIYRRGFSGPFQGGGAGQQPTSSPPSTSSTTAASSTRAETGVVDRRLPPARRRQRPSSDDRAGRAAVLHPGAASQDRRRAARPWFPRHRPRHRRAPLFQDPAHRLRSRHQPGRTRPRGALSSPGDGGGGRPHRLARAPGGGQALHRRHPRQPHLDAGGADRRRVRAVPKDLLARHHLARGDHDTMEVLARVTPTEALSGIVREVSRHRTSPGAPPTCRRPTTC